MEKTRHSPLIKNVEYIDFRLELSAFDKYFYFASFSAGEWYKKKQDFLRAKSKKLKEALDHNRILTYRGIEKNKYKVALTTEENEIINNILGKDYSSIEIIKHSWFNNWGFSIRLNGPHLKYTEAFAGSGETAIILLINRIFNASDKSLILLDEPECSLHPGAQKRLMEYILKTCISKKHQFIISTHSPFFIEDMPENSIKVFSTSPTPGKFIVNNKQNYKEAFYELEINNLEKKQILGEDHFAKMLIDKVLEEQGSATQGIFDVIYLSGGADAINQRIATFMEVEQDIYVFFDGDKKNINSFINLDIQIMLRNIFR